MSNQTDLTATAQEQGWALDSVVDVFAETRTTAVGDAGTIKMLFDRDGKLVAAYLMDDRRRQFRTTRIGQLKNWLEVTS